MQRDNHLAACITPGRFGSIPTVLSFTTSRSSRLAMKILIEMTPENYDRFLSKLSKASAPYTLLKNGVVTGGSAKENRIIEIACEMFEAKMLLNVAQMLCPQAALEIDKGVTLARPFQG